MLREAANDVIRISAQAVLGTSFTPVFTVGFQYQLTVSCIHLSNTSASAVTVQLCAVGPNVSPGAANALVWNFSIPANNFIEFGDGLILFSGWAITGLASVGAVVSVLVAGVQQ